MNAAVNGTSRVQEFTPYQHPLWGLQSMTGALRSIGLWFWRRIVMRQPKKTKFNSAM
jgi:hypothetical protein